MIPLSECTEAEEVPDDRYESDIKAVEAKLLWSEVRSWLNPKELFVLYARDVLELTNEAIGNHIGTSRERVRQVYSAAIANIRANPAIVHSFDLPIICQPDFPYETMWKSKN